MQRNIRWVVLFVCYGCLTTALPGVSWGAVITGTVIDATTKKALPSQSFPFTSLHLDRDDSFEHIDYTDCSPPDENGCVDEDGTFIFSTKSDGTPLEAGRYRLQVSSIQDYFPGPPVFFDFDGENDTDVGVIELEPSPVEIAFDCCPPPVASGGGTLEWTYRVLNVSDQRLKLETYAIVDTALTETGRFTRFQVGGRRKLGDPLPVRLGLRPQTFKEVTQGVHIPGETLDGCCICVTIRVAERKNLFMSLAETRFCVSKGDGGVAARVLTPAELVQMQMSVGHITEVE